MASAADWVALSLAVLVHRALVRPQDILWILDSVAVWQAPPLDPPLPPPAALPKRGLFADVAATPFQSAHAEGLAHHHDLHQC